MSQSQKVQLDPMKLPERGVAMRAYHTIYQEGLLPGEYWENDEHREMFAAQDVIYATRHVTTFSPEEMREGLQEWMMEIHNMLEERGHPKAYEIAALWLQAAT